MDEAHGGSFEAGGCVAANLGQLLGWVAARPRRYGETMEAWRTSCPRLSAWEDAVEAGLVRVAAESGQGYAEARVELTESGAARLAEGNGG
jgi:hypothetical protein